jgi:hypothetical protein
MKRISRLFFLGVVIAFSCKKNVSELPAPSQNGSNIFGCSIDGSLWVPAGFGIIPTAPTLEARYSGNRSIFINARNFSTSPTETEFEIHLENVTGTGTFLLNETTAQYPSHSASYAYYVKRKITPGNEWMTNTQYTGKVVVTALDSINKFISGTFEFDAINLYNDPAPIHVTEGRFDVKIQ